MDTTLPQRSPEIPNEPRIFSAWPKHEFFALKHAQGYDLTYDDVRTAERPAICSGEEVDLTSRFSRNIELKVPFASAAMDTVTEHKMAIAMAKLGGIGVIHANLSAEDQKEEVRKVKYELGAKVPEPFTFTEGVTLESILNECAEKGRDYQTFPVIDGNGVVRGLLTGSVFKYKSRQLADLTAGEAMIPMNELAYGTKSTTVEEAYHIMEERMIGAVPLLHDDGTLAGMYIWSDVESIMNGDAKQYNVDDRGRLRTAIAVSTSEPPDDLVARVNKVLGDEAYLDCIVIDTSKGAGIYTVPTLKLLKATFPRLDVIAGNVCEPESVLMLADAGADGVKVGVGPGSICTTRLEIGIGTPQLTAVYNAVEAVRGMDVPICADGGIQNKGDISVAIGAGASSVMMGGMWAATEESPGEKYRDKNGNWVKGYRGMGSESAIRERDVRGYGRRGTVILPEGIEKELPFKGSVTTIFMQAAKSLREGIAAGGSNSVEHFRENARFRAPTNSGIQEGKPHDVSS